MNTPDNQPAHATRRVEHPAGELHAVDRPGEDPPIVLMHGFPDDHHIYDRLTPLLRERTVAFDFLGYGQSDRPSQRTYARSDRQRELTAVIDQLDLDQPVLVGHDASGPEAIHWTLEHPDRVKRLVLLNTYYGHDNALRLPDMIRLFADPQLIPLANAMVEDPQQRLWLLTHTAKQFGMYPVKPDGIAAASIVPQYFGSEQQPDALAEIRAWTADLFDALDVQEQRIADGDLGRLATPTTLIFGRQDTYLNPTLAQQLTSLFANAQLQPIESASHWPQWDQPRTVATIIEKVLSEA